MTFIAGPLVAALIVAAAIVFGARHVAAEHRREATERTRTRALQLLTLFASASAATADDPRAILTWQPIASTARRLFPDEFAELDRAAGRPFPIGPEQIETAHGRWTSEWLAWELAHDAEYKLKAAAVEETDGGVGSALARARLDAIEREKLERYQRRYEEYVRVAKALQALTSTKPSA